MTLSTWLLAGCSLSKVSLDEMEAAKDVALSSAFEAQKGKMKPVKGRIESYTGCRNESESIIDTSCCFDRDRQTYIDDSTITAKAVADGKVVKVRTSEQTNICGIAIISHGVYTTVYTNLEKIFVKEGDEISSGQSIGEAGENYQGTRKVLSFDMYSKSGAMSPKDWLHLN